MGISVERDDAQRRFVAKATSPLTLAEILRFMSTHRVGAYRGYSLLFDVDRFFQLSDADIRTLANHVASLTTREGERGRTAIVAIDDKAYALAALYEALSTIPGVAIRAFRDLESAQEWLDGA